MAISNHSPTPEEVMAHLDGEAPPADRDRLDAHIAACADCRRLIADLRGISRDAAAWQVGDPPATLRVPSRESAAGRVRSWFFRPLMVGLASAAALAVVAVSFAPDAVTRASRAPQHGTASAAATSPPQAPDAHGATAFGARTRAHALTAAEPQMKAAPGPEQAMTARERPMLIRTARIDLVTPSFDSVRPAIERIVRDVGGFIDELNAAGASGSARSLRGTLRIPAARLDEAVTRIRELGQVVGDTQQSEDVTDQVVDLGARLANARATERRLADILRDRTGRLSDVLEVEREIARVRLEIERLDAERTNLGRRVTYSSVTINVTEERKVSLNGPLSLRSRLRIAFADGLAAAFSSLVGSVSLALRIGPTLIVWLAVGGFVWLLVRRFPKPALRR